MRANIIFTATISAPLFIGMAAAPAFAALPCKDNIAQVEASWNSVEKNYLGHPQSYEDDIHKAREACAAGKEAEATRLLDDVRAHLGIPTINRAPTPAGGK